jgi:hypothetical protein
MAAPPPALNEPLRGQPEDVHDMEQEELREWAPRTSMPLPLHQGDEEDQILAIQANVQLLRQQMEFLLEMARQTEERLSLLQRTRASALSETKREAPEEPYEDFQTEANIPEPPLSPREVLRRRQLQRFST